MALNQAQQAELRKILESDLFKTAKEEVLRMTDGSIDKLLAPEAAIKMAIEKGVRNAFRILHLLAEHTPPPATAPRVRSMGQPTQTKEPK